MTKMSIFYCITVSGSLNFLNQKLEVYFTHQKTYIGIFAYIPFQKMNNFNFFDQNYTGFVKYVHKNTVFCNIYQNPARLDNLHKFNFMNLV